MGYKTRFSFTNFKSRALNALFSVVTDEEFKKISSTKIAKKV